MKVSPSIYRGIEYVTERELPEDQQKQLGEFSSDLEFIKILMADGNIIDRCLTYKDYCAWYDAHFVPAAPLNAPEEAPSAQKVSIRIAFNP